MAEGACSSSEELESEQERLSGVVKHVHAELRARVLAGSCTAEEVWLAHIKDEEGLSRYAAAMHQLACGPWADKSDGTDEGRITWCVDACKTYFSSSLERLVRKDLVRMLHGMPTQIHSLWLPSEEKEVASFVGKFAGRRLALLDVGSCYDPFSQFDEFSVTSIDIAPAVKSVVKCDFLTIPILQESSSSPSSTHQFSDTSTDLHLYENSQDVVVFSLLLSYLPSPLQRLQSCHKAHLLLRPHGILLIVTPDSSHQNRHVEMIKSWHTAIEDIGFHRCIYHKSQHMHCMVFRKSRPPVPLSSLQAKHSKSLHIPQDFNTSLSPSAPSSHAHSEGERQDVKECFSELPCLDSMV